MAELGQLETRHADFAARNIRVVAASLDNLEETGKTQRKFPHLTLVSDAGRSLAGAAEVIGPHHSPVDGSITAAPTTVLIDRRGQVRWLFRPDRYLERLSPDEVLAKAAEHFGDGR